MTDELHPGMAALPRAEVRKTDQVCDAFEAAWRDGNRPRIEDYCPADGPADHALLTELVCVDIEYRRMNGEEPRPADYLARFPALSESWLGRAVAADPASGPGAAAAAPGQTFGRFELVGRVGQGACGSVWKARDPSLDRTVALKIPHPALNDVPQTVARFRREARAVAQLRHPGIAAVFEVAEVGGSPVVVQEFVDGPSLRDLLARRRLGPWEAAELAAQAADALDYAHRLGAVHRDVKPANLLVVPGPPARLVVVDFGLAMRDDGEALTADGQVVGTPAYMSPEQARGDARSADARTDVYGLGAVLYEMLTGEPPFRGTAPAVVRQVAGEEPRPPRRLDPTVPRDLETVCLKAMAKEPGRRYATAGDLAADLRRFLNGSPVRARPLGPAGRVWRWVRRRPAVAGLIVAAVVAALSTTAAGVAVAYNARLDRAYQEMSAAREAEATQHQRAEEALYANRVTLASREWADGNGPRAEQLLNECPESLRGWEWNYLHGLMHKEVFVLRHDTGPGSFSTVAVAWSPDGGRLATANRDGSVWVWDARTGRRVRTLTLEPTGYAQAVAWSPDGTRLAAGGVYCRLTVWDGDRYEVLFTRDNAGPQCVYGLAWSPDGTRLAAAYGDRPFEEIPEQARQTGRVTVWDVANRRERYHLPARRMDMTAVAFHPDGTRVLTAEGSQVSGGLFGDRPGELKEWDADTGAPLRTLGDHAGPVLAAAYSPDGTRILSGESDRTAVLWDAATGKPVGTLIGHRDGVRGVAFRSDGKQLATASADGSVRVWDAATCRLARILRGHSQAVNGVVYDPTGGRLASASSDQTVRVWDPSADQEAAILRHPGPVAELAFAPDGRLVSACNPTTPEGKLAPELIVWDTAGRRRLGSAAANPERAKGLAVSPDGKLVAVVGFDTVVRLWNLGADGSLHRRPDLRGHPKYVFCAAFSPDGRWLATGGDRWRGAAQEPPIARDLASDLLKVWDVGSGTDRRTLSADLTGQVRAVRFSPDGRWLAAGGSARQVSFWDPETGREAARLLGHDRALSGIAFSPDGRLLATASWDQTARLWDVGEVLSGNPVEPRAVLHGHTRSVLAVAFSPDGRRLATAGEDGLIKVWAASSGLEVLTLTGHTGPVTSVAFSPDGRRLFTASLDGTIRIW